MERFKTSSFVNRYTLPVNLFLLLAFTFGDSKSEYILPLFAYSVCSVDIDLDGDKDVVVGHIYNSSAQWSGFSIMNNDGYGNLNLFDSIYLWGGQTNVEVENLNENPLPEIIGKYVSSNPTSLNIAIIYDFNINNISYFNLFTDKDIPYVNIGDVNGDNYKDIVVVSNNGFFWRVLYNDGSGNFNLSPEYILESPPLDLTVGDIDGNGRDDIAICGSDTKIFYSFETGFQSYSLTGSEHEIELADTDNDGDLDVITMWGVFSATFIIYENLGYQNFQQHIIYSNSGNYGGLRTPDLDNDNFPDITYAGVVNFYVLYNYENFEFSESVTITPTNFPTHKDYTWDDIDNNNYKDIIIIRKWNEYIPNLKILFNDGNGNFEENPITKIPTSNFKLQTSNLTCYPNPFTNETTIEFNLKEKVSAEISIYDLSGKKVKNLIYNTTKGGSNTIKWDGLDNEGNPCKPGPYLVTLKVNGNAIQTIKLIKH